MRAAVDDEVHAFWQRRTRGGGLSDTYRFAAFRQYATNYLLEETATFFMMFEQDRAVDLYLGLTLLPHVLAPTYGHGAPAHFTPIDFKRRDARRLDAA